MNSGISKSKLTDTTRRKRFLRNDVPHLVYQDVDVVLVDLVGKNNNAFDVDLRRLFGDGDFVKIGAEDAI